MTSKQFKAGLKRMGWSHSDAARELGVTNRARVSEWTRGIRKVPPYIAAHMKTLRRLPPP